MAVKGTPSEGLNFGSLGNLAGLGYIALNTRGRIRAVALVLAAWQAVRFWRTF